MRLLKLVPVLFLFACADDVCVAGTIRACQIGGCEGEQVCNDFGSGYDLCSGCGFDAGADDAVTADAPMNDVLISDVATGGDANLPTELKAFPTAYGAGAYATGGRGGTIVAVTRLDDARNEDGSPVEGTFRFALRQTFPRVIIFRVSGTIVVGDLDGNGVLDASEVGDLRWPGMIAMEDDAYSNFTVAGQTAPEGGITVRGHVYTDQVSNMIWRYVRFRKNVDARTRADNESFHDFDALGFHDVENVIVDHVSLAFGTDEALDIDLLGATAGAGASVQYTVLSDSKTGTILGGNGPEAVFSFHNNFYSRITHRFPNVGGDGHFEVANNLVHNWRFRLVNVHNELSVNHVNNAYVAGVRTRDTPDINNIANRIHPGTEGILDTRIFTAGNFITDVLTDPSADNWSSWQVFIDGGGLSQNDPAPASMQVFEAFPRVAPAAPLRTAQEVMASLPDEVGAFRTLDENGNVVEYRDDIDRSLIAEYRDGDGEGSAYTYSRDGFVHVEVPSNAPYTDTDGDGMPDAWESAHGFDPATADDAGDADGDGYTNIEEFLSEVDG